eukprot:CAMPEP_0197926626 /NCGR_PEP_ID=MMETSP1439-20131203/99442_1 /TAXON_ID=66791 /ORGANISM="Gonyaulax spinifera, Strain CCMP409" /LENGTH=170 /DNA_ID=CAMNT_0043549165 /DNA_START=167 /DNA_END=679 /DNA_ORIENTATION=-
MSPCADGGHRVALREPRGCLQRRLARAGRRRSLALSDLAQQARKCRVHLRRAWRTGRLRRPPRRWRGRVGRDNGVPPVVVQMRGRAQDRRKRPGRTQVRTNKLRGTAPQRRQQPGVSAQRGAFPASGPLTTQGAEHLWGRRQLGLGRQRAARHRIGLIAHLLVPLPLGDV